MTDSTRIFDPALVIPSESSLYDRDFWERLSAWHSASRPPVMGQATYLRFAENCGAWLTVASGSDFRGYVPLISRLASSVVDPWLYSYVFQPVCTHISDSYLVDDLCDLLIEDLNYRPTSKIQIVTEFGYWKNVSQADSCNECLSGNVRMLVDPDGHLACLLTGRLDDTPVAKMPIRNVGECKYDSYFNHYVHDLDSDLWWSVDFANHGGSAFKTFRRNGSVLQHESDRDSSGNPIGAKHKGEIGLSLSLSGLQNCSYPQRHVS